MPLLNLNVLTPEFVNLYPNGDTLLQNSSQLSFNAYSSAAFTNIQVILNGADVSSSLAISGPTTNRAVSYPLQSNKVYTASITIQDVGPSRRRK